MPSTILGEHAVTLPTGTTAQRPSPASAGMTRYNTTTGSMEFYDGANWVSTNLIPSVNSVTGNIYVGVSNSLTLSVTNATDSITVRYSEGGATVKDVAATVTAGSTTTTVPSEVFGQTAGDTISITIFNQDGTPASNSITKTVLVAPTGGTITTTGSFRVHTFTSSGTFATGGFAGGVEYLVVGGGAGGIGHNSGGGGGAGGFRTNVTGATSGRNSSAEGGYTLTANTNYTVTVGAGSSGGGNSNGFPMFNGSDSVFGVITSLGGGKAGDGQSDGSGGTRSGGNGGCGGGHRPCPSGTQGSGTAGQGFDGGLGDCGPAPYPGGGGGGAGAVGGSRSAGQTQAGPGGVGIQSSINGTATFYAGGGGGSTQAGGSARADGGSGGGGFGGWPSAPTPANGGANTGGGGGAGDGAGGSGSGNGGSGIVIVRYTL